MKKMDFLLIVVVLIIAVIFYIFGIKSYDTKNAEVVVYINGIENKRFSLDENIQFDIEQNGHKNILVISNGFADIIEADCPDKYCVNQKKISKVNEKIICLPNKVVIEIENGEISNIDGIAN